MKIPIVFTFLCLLLLAGCATTPGIKFRPEGVKTITLGDTSRLQALAEIGIPVKETEIENELGTYHIMTFGHGQWSPLYTSNDATRLLFVEVLNGKVNGYFNFSLLVDEQPAGLNEAMDKLKREEHMTKDVRALLGEPNGRALYPTSLSIFEDLEYHETWVYVSVQNDGLSSETTTLLLGFDRKGTLQNFGKKINRERY